MSLSLTLRFIILLLMERVDFRPRDPEFMQVRDPNILKNVLLQRLAQKDPAGLVGRAIETAENAHAGQTRKEGTPYILHPFRVSLRLMEEGEQPLAAIAVGVMHDALEDCPTLTRGDLESSFGVEISQGVEALSKTHASTGIKKDTDEYFRNLASPNTPDYVRRIKVYDRIDNLYSILLLVETANDSKTRAFVEKYLAETDRYFIDLASFDPSLSGKLNEAVMGVKSAVS